MFKKSAIYFFVILLLALCRCSHTKDDFTWEANFQNTTHSIYMGDSKNINLTINILYKVDLIASNSTIHVFSDSNILQVTKLTPGNKINGDKWNGFFTIDFHWNRQCIGGNYSAESTSSQIITTNSYQHTAQKHTWQSIHEIFSHMCFDFLFCYVHKLWCCFGTKQS